MNQPHPMTFFGLLNWLDGRPLLDAIEPYRQRILTEALFTFEDDGRPLYNLALCGRAKKNWKTADLVLACLYRFLAWQSPQGNDCFILANDEGQARDDLVIAKKLIEINPTLKSEVDIKQKEITRIDGKGTLQVLPAKDVAGAHGKTYLFVGFDEIHAYKSHDLFEALAPDPTRRDVLIWITSYAGIRHAPGVPLYDYMQRGKNGDDDRRMYFSWFAGDYCSDPARANLTQVQRANPSLDTFEPDYLDQQKKRLPTHKYRRLHLNLPGAPDGAAFSGEHVMAAIVSGRQCLRRELDRAYCAFVDMSGGSADDATLGIAHWDRETKRAALDVLICQTGDAPFNPRDAVRKFANQLKEYGLSHVVGDAYGGQTFRADFQVHGVTYEVTPFNKSQLYEALEPRLNAGEVELLDHPKLQEQMLTLVLKGEKIDHLPGDHDDFANAAAGALWLAARMATNSMSWNKPIVFQNPRGISSNPSYDGPVRISEIPGTYR